MEKLLVTVIFAPIFFYLAYRKFRLAKKIEDEEYEKEKKLTPKQKVETNLRQDQKHKNFFYLIPVGILLMFILKNTIIGYFIGFGTIGLVGKIWIDLFIRWTKSQPYNKAILIMSFILFIFLIALLAALFYPQILYIYQDEIK
jgi:hypothetical protein